MNDTLIIQNCDNPLEKISVPKLLRSCSMHKLHNNLLEKSSSVNPNTYDENGNIIISDTALRALLPLNVEKLTKNTKRHVDVKCVF